MIDGKTRRYVTGGLSLWFLALAGFPFLTIATANGGSSAPIRDRKHQFQRRVESWRRLRTRNIVMQQRDYSCGAAALATLIRHYWGDQVAEVAILRELDKMLTREEVRDRIRKGLSLTDLRRVAVRLGYLGSIGKLDLEKLAKARVPLIVGITIGKYDHFVVVRGVEGGYVYLADPARGNTRTPTEKFMRQWQQNLVLVVAKRGAGLVADAPLKVRPGETTLGQLNRHVIRRNAVKPPKLFPSAIRP